ncbi:MAG: SRPBCC domain-containing protein [Bacteroidota bacterium]
METKHIETQLLIRVSAEKVFNAFIDPSITTNFWYTKSSGKLEAGKTVVWEWEMYGAKDEVQVLDVDPGKTIKIVWGDPKSKVDFTFEEFATDQTLVKIKCYDFEHPEADLLPTMLDYISGFTTVLDGLKAYLEHGINLNLIADKFPDKAK